VGRPPAPKRKIVVRKYAIFPRESLKSYDANNYSRNQFFEMLYLSVKRVATTIVSMSDILWLQSGALSCDRFQ
jgi:ribosomal protein L15E